MSEAKSGACSGANTLIFSCSGAADGTVLQQEQRLGIVLPSSRESPQCGPSDTGVVVVDGKVLQQGQHLGIAPPSC